MVIRGTPIPRAVKETPQTSERPEARVPWSCLVTEVGSNNVLGQYLVPTDGFITGLSLVMDIFETGEACLEMTDLSGGVYARNIPLHKGVNEVHDAFQVQKHSVVRVVLTKLEASKNQTPVFNSAGVSFVFRTKA